MNSTHHLTLHDVFKENGYKLTTYKSISVIRKRNSTGSIGFVLSILVGLILLTFGLYIGLHAATVLSGFFFIGFPILFDRWRYPRIIIIDQESAELILRSGFTYTRKFRLSDISGINVDEAILTSDTSPFKDGYQDFIYSFQLMIASHKIKFIKFLFRKDSADEVSGVFEYLNQQLSVRPAA